MLQILPLSARAVKEELGAPDVRIQLYDSTDSTNQEARRLIRAAGADVLPCTVIAARAQTAGRGRMGRSFYSPKDSGLYMTLVYPLTQPIGQAVAVTGAAAVATCAAISEMTGLRPDIKWVNDLYLGGKKLCGILAEAVTAPSQHYMVVGIGINLTTEAFPADLRHPGGCLAAFLTPDAALPEGSVLDAGRLCGSVARHLLTLIREDALYAQETLTAYRAHSILPGKEICCTQGNSCFTALALGITDDYGLLIRRTDGREEVLSSGEVSVSF